MALDIRYLMPLTQSETFWHHIPFFQHNELNSIRFTVRHRDNAHGTLPNGKAQISSETIS
jgi:hypothetical protein